MAVNLEDSNKPVVTLQDIANAAGVSKATVSRALKSHPRIGEKTIARVKKLADQMGYRRDAHLTDLMIRLRQRKQVADRPVMAFLLWQHLPVDRANFSRKDTVFGGLWHRAWECGYQPELFNLADFDDNQKRLAQILYSRGIRAGILCPVERPAPLPDLPWEFFSLVAIGYSVFSHQLHRCANNHYEGMLECVEHLKGLGYRRIGAVLTHSLDRRTHGYYHAAYLLSQNLYEDGVMAPLLYADGQGDEKAFNRWFDKWQPEAIVCANAVYFVRQWLEKRGLNIPTDVGLADLQYPSPSGHSGILQNVYEVGVAAVDLLITLLQNNETGLPAIPRTIFVDGQWIDGLSTRKIR